MKTKSLKISKSCQENWDKMLSNNDGRFCNLCEKSVIDFTGLSQKEISNTIKKSKGSICAKVTSSQLKTPFLDITEQTNYRLPYSKAAASIMLVASIASAQSCDSRNSSITSEVTISQHPSDGTVSSKNKNSRTSISKNSVAFTGKVVRFNDKGIENVKITLVTLDKLFITHSSSDGGFSMQIPEEFIDDSNVVRFEYNDIVRLEKDENNFNDYFENNDVVLTKLELTSEYKMSCPEFMISILGDITFSENDTYTPIVIIDGIKTPFKEFEKAMQGKKSSCNVKNKGYMFFEPQAAIALYGEAAKNGLYLFSKDIKKH